MLLSYLLPLFFVLSACSTARKIERPFYYEAKYQGKTYHFLGTMHQGFTLDSLPERIRNDLAKAKIVRIELTNEMYAKLADAELERLKAMAQKMHDHDPQLRTKLKPKTWEHLSYTLNHDDVKKYLQSLGVKHSSLEVHPIMVMHITYHFAELSSDFVFHPNVFKGHSRYSMLGSLDFQAAALDREIESYAKEKNIPLQSLDTPSLVHNSMSLLSKNIDIQYIENMFGGIGAAQSTAALDKLAEDFSQGNESKMSLFLNQSEEFDRTILFRRNEHWFNALIEEGHDNIFVAVGALHLVGENSLLSHFRKHGVNVVRVEDF